MVTSKNLAIDREKAIVMLRWLEIIVPSLARLGSAREQLSKNEYDRLSSEFLDDWDVTKGLLFIRNELSGLFSYDELEDLYGQVPSWSMNSPKPPSGFDQT